MLKTILAESFTAHYMCEAGAFSSVDVTGAESFSKRVLSQKFETLMNFIYICSICLDL